MKTIYKYIYFEVIEEKPKTKVWGCFTIAGHSRLGEVKWYGPWRQYTFSPIPDTDFSMDCLDDIKHFLGQLKR